MSKKLKLKLTEQKEEEKNNLDESFYEDIFNSLSEKTKQAIIRKKEEKANMKEIEESNKERFSKAVEAYKKYAYVKSPEELRKENLYGNALRKASDEYAIPVDELEEALIRESDATDADSASKAEIAAEVKDENPGVTDSQAEQAADIAKTVANNTEADLAIVYVEGELEKELNRSLEKGKIALRKYYEKGRIDKNYYQNILVIGDVGVGKTEKVKAWAKAHGVRLVTFKADSLTIDDIKGIPVGRKEGTDRAEVVNYGTFDVFDAKNENELIVLYLDEYNRAKGFKRAAWFKFMDEHTIQDPTNMATNEKFFPNLLFTVATINPYFLKDESGNTTVTDDEEGVEPLSKAEINRFATTYELSTKDRKFNADQLKYYEKYFVMDTKDIPENAVENARKLALVRKLLQNPNFYFNTTKQISKYKEVGDSFLTPRSLTILLNRCDGTKEDFLRRAVSTVNPENAKMLKTFLSDYTDVPDEANAVWRFWDEFGLDLDELKEDESKEEPKDEEDFGDSGLTGKEEKPVEDNSLYSKLRDRLKK